MSGARAAVLALACGFAFTACDGSRAPGGASQVATVHARLGTGIAAVVGTVEIPVVLVADVARAQRAEPRVALDHLVSDALAAQGARDLGGDRDPTIAWALESILARSTAERLKETARAAGPADDAELARVTANHWREVDLPEQVKVIHVLVLRPKDASQIDAARALAARLATAVGMSTSEDDFEARAKAVSPGSLSVHVERLPSFVADGRTAEGDPNLFDPAFAQGAFALKVPGEVSGVVESSFGWHVIRLLERRPARVLSPAERRARFASEVLARRGHDAFVDLLGARRASTAIEIEPGVDARLGAAFASPTP